MAPFLPSPLPRHRDLYPLPQHRPLPRQHRHIRQPFLHHHRPRPGSPFHIARLSYHLLTHTIPPLALLQREIPLQL